MPVADLTEQSHSGWATAGFMGVLNIIETVAERKLPFSQDDIVKLQQTHDRLGKVIDTILAVKTKSVK